MSWIDTTVVVIVVAMGVIILYRALKEPLDMLFGFIGRSLGGLKDKVSNREGSYYDEIRYG